MKWEVYKTKVDLADELLARILDAAASIKKREYQLRRTTRDLRTQVAKFTDFNGGIFEYLLRTVTNLSFLCHKLFVKHEIRIEIKLTVRNFSFFIKIYHAFLFEDSNISVFVRIQN